MIEIIDKAKCCGCSACGKICPKDCISFHSDEEGFLYPKVDLSTCVDCHLCEKVCPELQERETRIPIATYAAYNNDEAIRAQSSSGGVFSMLANEIIKSDGVVFGASFDENWMVVHSEAESVDGLVAFRGSKYLQSNLKDTFCRVKERLIAGRKVLFTGASCQVAGLKNFLKKEYENLLTVDFVCHGVPSPGVWKSYLSEQLRPQGAAAGKNTDFLPLKEYPVKGINFRDKRLGWKKYGFRLSVAASKGGKNSDFASKQSSCQETYQTFPENPYMRMFLSDLSLRPACYECPAKAGRSGSDITLGDFWGIENVDPQIDDDKGMSLVLVNSPKGKAIFDRINCFKKPESFDYAVKYNPSILKAVHQPAYRDYFMRIFARKGFAKAYTAMVSTALLARIKRRLWRELNRRK